MDLIMSTKWTITRLECAVMLHNQTAMKVSIGTHKSNVVCSIVARFCGPLRTNVLLLIVFVQVRHQGKCRYVVQL